ncbi:MAG TPA: DNA repair protein RadC [Chloroflexota bacterium]|nr:DNA repair protein RadC [Chloroflexota bacterium]
MREWPTSERPRERLLIQGPGQLSNAELLAIVLRTGSGEETVLGLAQALLAQHGGLPGLRRATAPELREHKGLGDAKIAQLKAALELGQRLSLVQEQPLRITSAADAAAALMVLMSELEQEQLRLVLVNTKNDVLGWPVVYTGGLRTALVRLPEVLRIAIRENASGFIVAHNHPSGDPTPSPEDIRFTRELVKAGQLLDVDVLDHIIIGRGRYVSLRSLKIGF